MIQECNPENDRDNEGRRLEKAEADLAEAGTELVRAEHKVELAETEVREAVEELRQKFRVDVLYDGVKKPFEVRREELVKKLLDEAIKAFGPIPTPNHLLALFNTEGTELKDNETMKQADVKPHDTLLLRPSKVKGGA